MKHILLFLLFTLSMRFSAMAQCSISGKTKVCLGDLAVYELTNSNVNSIKWRFGDGYTSTDKTTKYVYKNTGIYTLSFDAVLSNGTNCSDSMKVEVVGLPKAVFIRNGSLDSCQFVNNVCFLDASTPAVSGQDIAKRLVVWGDGAYDLSENPSGALQICHSYKTVDNFRIKFEITDIYGCKSSFQSRVKIVKGPQAKIKHDITYPDCGKARVCFTNVSDTPLRSNNMHEWILAGNKLVRNGLTTECFETSSSNQVIAQLTVSTFGGCTTTVSDTVYINLQPINIQLSGTSSMCYNSSLIPHFWVTGDKDVSYKWYLDGKYKFGKNRDSLRFNPKQEGLNPGKHRVKVEVNRGPCVVKDSLEFMVEGPKAVMGTYNRLQCVMKNKVFMWDDTELKDKSKASWHWVIDDVEGEACTSWRVKGQNLYKNCNEAKDWWHKHSVDSTRKGVNIPISMAVYDSITGCTDTTKNTIVEACNLFCGNGIIEPYIEICQGELFLKQSELSYFETDPVSFSLDTGRTFQPYPSSVLAPHKGLYGVILVWKKSPRWTYAEDFGNDSIKIYRDTSKGYDTVFYPDLLNVMVTHDTDFQVTYSGVNPKKIKITPGNPQFKKGDKLRIFWGDIANTITDTVMTEDGFLDSFTHQYDTCKYLGTITIVWSSKNGCSNSKIIEIGWGLDSARIDTDAVCGSNKICFKPYVRDYSKAREWKKYDGIGHRFRWEFGESAAKSTEYSPCYTYSKPGRYNIKMYVYDSFGYVDSAQKTIIVQDLVAGVTSESKTFFCSEIKQLFDSSFLRIQDADDSIVEYLWDFGEGTYTTIEKNPYHTFENGGTYVVSHVVISKKGCTDTTTFTVNISGSEAAFDLVGDTVGCAPFLVTLHNRSKNCSQFIWEFGDLNNSTHNTDTIGVDTFRYYHAGRFRIGLIGIDTIYNQTTGNVYYCNSYFPHKDSPQIVTVLPSPKTGLTGPDTICAGRTAEFVSLSDMLYEKDVWVIDPDTAKKYEKPGKMQKRQYNTPGIYFVKLNPYYTILPGQPRCFDSAVKKLTVLGVRADFDIDPKSKDPVFTFSNKSNPIDADFLWNFGHPMPNADTSTEVHPTHDFYPDKDTFRVCLYASLPAGCYDTVCKTIQVNYHEEIKLANVFTPNEEDELNKYWDIIIEGEKLYQLRIYNRWGELVFASDTDAEQGATENWNGTVMNNGSICPEGTYFFQFAYAFSRGEQETKTVSGYIKLLR